MVCNAAVESIRGSYMDQLRKQCIFFVHCLLFLVYFALFLYFPTSFILCCCSSALWFVLFIIDVILIFIFLI